MDKVFEFMPGVCVFEPTPGPIDKEKAARETAELTAILNAARLKLAQEEMGDVQ